MPNPVLNERTLRSAPATWAPPAPTTMAPPISDGPVSTWRPQVMTVNGAISATATLLVLLLAAVAGIALFFLLQIAWNWQGGGGFVGNRYFVNVYPAFLFLVTRIRPRWTVPAGYAFAGLFLGPLLFTPFGAGGPEPDRQRLQPVRLQRDVRLAAKGPGPAGRRRYPVASPSHATERSVTTTASTTNRISTGLARRRYTRPPVPCLIINPSASRPMWPRRRPPPF